MNQLENLFPKELQSEGDDAPVFQQPWQAKAFALTHILGESSVFTWNEWTEAFSAKRTGSDLSPDAADYFDQWVDTLQDMIVKKGITRVDAVETLSSAWQRAAHATPHGKPILLENDPLKPAQHGRDS